MGMKNVKKVIKKIHIINTPIWNFMNVAKSCIVNALVKIFGNNRIILLESIPDKSDSSLELYNELRARGYKPIWCTHKRMRGCLCCEKQSIISRFLFLIASYTFFTHFCVGNARNKRQKRCFVTHGMSFKNTLGAWGNTDSYSDIVCLSEMHRDLRRITMPGSESKTIVMGYPRNDALYRNSNVARRVFGIGSGSKIVLWLPTFRHLCNPNGDKRSDYSVSGRDEFNLLTDNTLSGLDVVLGELNIFIIVKYHPNQDLDYVSTSRDYKNILTLTSDEFVKYGIGLYQVLSETDALIADFSSVYIDFLLRDRPIAFDVTDMEDYSNGIGFTVDNPREYMPGPFISGIDDLKSFLTDVYKGVDGYSDERKRVRDIVHQYRDGNSTERLLDYYGLYKG